MSQSRMGSDVPTGSQAKRTDDAGECTNGRALSRPLRAPRFPREINSGLVSDGFSRLPKARPRCYRRADGVANDVRHDAADHI